MGIAKWGEKPVQLQTRGLLTKILIISTMGLFDFIFRKEDNISKKHNRNEKTEVLQSYNHEYLQSSEFERYIFVKGLNLSSIDSKLNEYAELKGSESKFTDKFKKAISSEWYIIKMPDDWIDYYEFHNLIYWFLGYPPEDKNYADISVGISIKKNSNESYLLYNDYALEQELGREDSLFGIFINDKKFILNIPFDKFQLTKNPYISTYQAFLLENRIDIGLIQSEKTSFMDLEVNFKK